MMHGGAGDDQEEEEEEKVDLPGLLLDVTLLLVVCRRADCVITWTEGQCCSKSNEGNGHTQGYYFPLGKALLLLTLVVL